jgi:hypothetical protein
VSVFFCWEFLQTLGLGKVTGFFFFFFLQFGIIYVEKKFFLKPNNIQLFEAMKTTGCYFAMVNLTDHTANPLST